MRLLFALALFWAALTPAAAEEPAQVDFGAVAAEIRAGGDAAVTAYEAATGSDTADLFSALYFDVFEGSGMELAVGLADPALKAELESLFGAVIGLAMRGAPREEVAAAWSRLDTRLYETAAAQSGTNNGFFALLLQSFLILLREGFEAILVVTALAAYLRRSGAADKLPVIYHGVAWALVASLVTAYLLTTVLTVSGAAREGLEGATMLVAAAVLFYVSYWLFAKREAVRWQQYVQGRIDRALSGGSLFTLGFAAFLAVYREGAETVLFYQALMATSQGHYSAVVAGFLLAALALAALYWAMRGASLRLPLGVFFGFTAVLLYYLAVVFAGKGVLELQEARWIPITPLDGWPRLEWLGVFPSLEGMAVQAVLLAALILALASLMWRSRASAEAMLP